MVQSGTATVSTDNSILLVVLHQGDDTNPSHWESVRKQAQSSGFSVEIVTLSSATSSVTGLVNAAIKRSVATFVAVVTNELTFTKDAFERLRDSLLAEKDLDIVYGNSVQPGAAKHDRSVLRPALSPERLRCQFYLGNFVLIRRAFLEKLGGFDDTRPGAQLYDSVLRGVRAGATATRIEFALTEVRGNQSTVEGFGTVDWALASRSLTATLEEHLQATGGGKVVSVGENGVHQTVRSVVGNPLVSIVIPTRGIHANVDGVHRSFLLEALASITEMSTYTNIEFVIVVDDVAEPGVLTELRRLTGEKLRLVTWDKPFNFSDKVNFGAVHASGEFLLILNDDVVVITPDWIERLLALAQLPGAGMAGAMLYFEDDTIQHAGHAYYRGEASHVGLDQPRGDPGPLAGYRVEREIAGVTAACALMPRAVFYEAGGLSGLLPGNFNDVDLCMKVTWLGYEIYWTPHAELYHFESKTRDATVMSFEVDVHWGRWANRMHDAAYWPYPLTRQPVSWISGIW
ncbi:MAG: GT2 family glycosyltransferase [Alpinimonas sp.]|jgi:GT2 family glycosyltransferase